MTDIDPEVLAQLDQAQAELMQTVEAGGPPVAAELTQAKSEVMLDHYFGSSVRRLWAHAGGAWRYRNVTTVDEQGVAQVAFAANRVDAWWDAANVMTLMRCWKTF